MSVRSLRYALTEAIRVDPAFMRPYLAHPGLVRFEEECRAIFVRLLAYFGGLLALAVIISDLISGPLPLAAATRNPTRVETWTRDIRPHAAFSVAVPEFADKTESYEILRHAEGGRKDVLRWTSPDGLAASIVLYRPGAEIEAQNKAPETILAGIPGIDAQGAQPLGIAESKFGPVRLFAVASRERGGQCVGFFRGFEEPNFRMGGVFCGDGTGTEERARTVCRLNRLALLAAGGDSNLAALFARADLRSQNCQEMSSSQATNWLSALTETELRGRL